MSASMTTKAMTRSEVERVGSTVYLRAFDEHDELIVELVSLSTMLVSWAYLWPGRRGGIRRPA